MPIDFNVFNRIKTKQDFDREAAEFDMRKKQAQMNLQLGQQKLDAPLGGGQDPAAVREWQTYSQLPPEDQERYLQMKRADQIMNLGGTQAVRGQLGGIQEQYAVTPKPEQMPEFKAEQEQAIQGVRNVMEPIRQEDIAQRKAGVELATKPQIAQRTQEATEIGKDIGTRAAELGVKKARMPQLFRLVDDLSALGKEATFTRAGQAYDVGVRELLGADTPGSVARDEYISKVNNEVLPLLRETFGAQFTVQEGESLKVTLGDPNKTPKSKDAVLRSFISTKMQSINTDARALGEPEPYTQRDILEAQKGIGVKKSLYDQGEQRFNQGKDGVRMKWNPQTGDFE